METSAKDVNAASPFGGLKILIADDHHLVREGLKLTLRTFEPSIDILEAQTLEQATRVFLSHPGIDLVLLDLSMPGTRELSAVDDFAARCPSARVVVVSASYDMKTVRAAVQKGALGFIPKLAGRETLIGALRFILEGGIYVPPEAFSSDGEEEASPPPPPAAPVMRRTPAEAGLTPRQVDVLRLLVKGMPNKVICRELNLAMGTVKSHVAAILLALDVNSRGEAIAAAGRNGWQQWLEGG
ncbi:MAG: response regulator transcription factor [Burkholderiaceae bacterium]